MGMDDVVVVIPTLNEERAIGLVIEELLAQGLSKGQIVVVDGRSSDRTREIARRKGVKVIIQRGRGKADAIATAVDYLDSQGSNFKYVVIMDGDYTYPAKYIVKLLERAGTDRCDEVIGVRVRGREHIPKVLRLGNWFLTKLFNILFGTKLKDVLSGMYLVKAGILKEISWETSGFSIEAEIAAHVVSSGRVCEVPIEYRERLGKKKLGVRHGFLIAKDIIRLVWRYNPTFFIFGLGALLLIPGLILGGWVAYHYFFTGIKYYVKGVIAIIISVSGFNSFLLAVLSLYLKRMEDRLKKRLATLEKILRTETAAK